MWHCDTYPSFDYSGVILSITNLISHSLSYTDGTTAEITSGYTYTPSKLTTAGQQKIVVTYGGKSTGFYVTVA